MRALYRRHYAARLRAVADLVGDGESVLDLCCGPSALYARELRARGVRYTGVDASPQFLRHLASLGATVIEADVGTLDPLPRADHVLMLSSLYHFLPRPDALLHRMLAAAGRSVIILEPVHNLASSGNALLRFLAVRFADAGTEAGGKRFDEESLDALFGRFEDCVVRSFAIPGGREKLYVLRGGAD